MGLWGERGSSAPRTAARWGRRLLWCLAGLFVLTVLPGALGAVAVAQDGAAGSSRMDGVAWMNIRDSFGVALADYTYVSDKGGLLDPGGTVVWTIVGLEFVGYMIIVTTAIWFIGFALSFAWLDFFADALRGTAGALTAQLATPAVLVTAATIGAFFVAWFIVRGFHARAVIQTVTMLAVAVLGPLFLADPLAAALGSGGVLAQGRDVGLAVASGLNGSANRNPDLAVSTLQGDMADNFARRPVQVWNFGHIVDNQSACAAAWSSGVSAGDTDRTQRALEACGDTAAAAAAAHPSVGQIGTGLLLLVSAAVLLLFAVVLSYRLMRAALDAIMQGFMAVFGFAAGGFVFGPSQTFLVRNLVNTGIAAARMCAYTVFIGVYLLFLGNLFQQARGQVLAVIVIAAVVETVAILQFGRLAKGLTRGSNWMTNRFALTIQGARRLGRYRARYGWGREEFRGRFGCRRDRESGRTEHRQLLAAHCLARGAHGQPAQPAGAGQDAQRPGECGHCGEPVGRARMGVAGPAELAIAGPAGSRCVGRDPDRARTRACDQVSRQQPRALSAHVCRAAGCGCHPRRCQPGAARPFGPGRDQIA